MSSRDESKQDGSPTGVPPSFGASASPPPDGVPSAGAQPEPDSRAAESRAPEPEAPVQSPFTVVVPQDPATPVLPPEVPLVPAGPYASPAAGPYAAAGGGAPGGKSGGRGVRSGLAARSGLGAGRMPAWGSGRSKLVNAALFGFAPLALVGIVAVAFVLSSSGKGQAASHAGFQAGAAVSAGQQSPGAGSASPGAPAPSASKGKSNGHSGQRSSTSAGQLPSKSASVPKSGHNPGPKPKSSHRPKPKSGPPPGPVTPVNLGKPNFDGYCAHIGWGSAITTASNAYGWHCSLNSSLVLSVRGACAWTYNLSASMVIHVSTDYYNPDSWQCWRTNGVLGQLNFSTYCVNAGLGAAKLNAGNAYGWVCTGAGAVNPDAACQFVYHRGTAFARFAVFADPYSWQCWD